MILDRHGAWDPLSLGRRFKWNVESKLERFLDVYASHRGDYTSIVELLKRYDSPLPSGPESPIHYFTRTRKLISFNFHFWEARARPMTRIGRASRSPCCDTHRSFVTRALSASETLALPMPRIGAVPERRDAKIRRAKEIYMAIEHADR